MREKLLRHRADPSCSACHNLMDPIGFGLENFDWMGRWRDKEADGKPIDAIGRAAVGREVQRPGGTAAGAAQPQGRLRAATGRQACSATRWAEACRMATVARCSGIMPAVEKDGYRARTLIREIVLSVPFRNTQGGVVDDGAGRFRRRR